MGKEAQEKGLAPIKTVFLEPEDAKPLNDALEAIKEADVIILGPGSLYTSVIPNLLVGGIAESIEKSKAAKIYVCNIMTQPGETQEYTVSDHIKALYGHSKEGLVDYCIVNNAPIPDELLELYKDDGANYVKIDTEEILMLGVQPIENDLLGITGNLIRHDPSKLAESVIQLITDKVLSKDKKRIIDYYYVKDRLKKVVK